jgi:hypothetical protein
MADRPLGVDFTSGKEIIIAPLTAPTGGDDGGKLVAIKTDGSNKIDSGFVPSVTEPSRTYTAIETVGARKLVYIDYSSGDKAGLAVATASNKRGHGYTEAGAAASAAITVKFGGEVAFDIGASGVVAGDVGLDVYLGTTAGAPMKAPGAVTQGQYHQRIGTITYVDTGNSLFYVQLDFGAHREVL